MLVQNLTRVATAVALTAALSLAADPALASEQELIDKSISTLDNFLGDPDMDALREQVKSAKAVMIVPDFKKAGFIIGGKGGKGVILARGADGSWSPPAFYKGGGGSVGAQFGASQQEILLVIMSEAALGKLMDGKSRIGGDIDVAAGPTGAGVRSSAGAQIYGYVKQKGGYVGANFEGGAIEPDNDANKDYYDLEVTPRQILVDRAVNNAAANPLQQKLAQY
ncbi:MAG: lipid-binding SYLF domain-containing protein [Alphaproteobacteria bacterium]|nr:lipid-binding SYLF domain-containing protein [Alphaproteobacteria bacterium]